MRYEHALAATRSLRDRPGEGLAELGRAQCLTRLADIDQASEAARRAEHLAAGEARTLGRVSNVLAMLAFQTGDWDAAASNLRAAAEHHEKLDDRFNCGRALHGSGSVARSRGDLAEARACWQAALEYLDPALPEAAAPRDALAELSSVWRVEEATAETTPS